MQTYGKLLIPSSVIYISKHHHYHQVIINLKRARRHVLDAPLAVFLVWGPPYVRVWVKIEDFSLEMDCVYVYQGMNLLTQI
jgi:hypothetical protein